jgi:four helix bundle protein
MTGSRFRELVAYQRARTLADAVRTQVLEWDAFDRWSLGIQLVRAVDSIAANIAEAYGRWSPADQRRILHIARGSLLEAEHWITCADERRLMDSSKLTPLVEEAARTLNGLIKSIRGPE